MEFFVNELTINRLSNFDNFEELSICYLYYLQMDVFATICALKSDRDGIILPIIDRDE